MTTHKVCELEGVLLNRAAAKASGVPLLLLTPLRNTPTPVACARADTGEAWEPSTNWTQGGPIIERERIQLQPHRTGDGWLATTLPRDVRIPGAFAIGPTLLIAAMRAYVASKFGETVELP